MRSEGILEGVDFGRDLPTSEEDNEALWQVRELNRMSPAEYLAFLNTFTRGLPPDRSANSDSDLPFEL